MASSIGLRAYQFYVTEERSTAPIDLRDVALKKPLPEVVSEFVEGNSTVNQRTDLERSWYFEERPDPSFIGSRGHVHYGTFGFESNLVDGKTKKNNYRRKSTDVEEIPLFYEFWLPEDESYGLAAFQSFQGRSCVQLVALRMVEQFERSNDGYSLKFRKLMPTAGSSAYAGAPVKSLRLLRRNAPSDLADRYRGGDAYGGVDFEIIISARRKSSLGNLGSVSRSLPRNKAGVVTHDGVEFDQAIADIQVGRRKRPVYVFGASGNAGVFDLSDIIERGADGHPTFDSIASEASDILSGFNSSLSRHR